MEDFNKCVDTWFVNLDSRPDRLEHITAELDRVGIKAQRQRGMLPEEYTGDPKIVKAMQDRTPGAIGCHFSQRAIIERAAQTRRDVLILEDDAVFCDDFPDRWKIIKGFMHEFEWDVFSLGATFHVNPPVWHKDDLGRDVLRTIWNPHILRTYGIWSTYAWMVNGRNAARLLRRIDENTEGSIGIDALMIKLQPDLFSYCFVPGCVKQRDDRSNIGVNQDGSPAVTKFSGFAKLGPYWWQPRMEDFNPNEFDWAEANRT